MNMDQFDEFISEYPVYEYRLISTDDIEIVDRVRVVCREECTMYNTTWACPPAVGSIENCERRVRSYPQALFFSSISEVTDMLDMKQLLEGRMPHEELTNQIGQYISDQGYETYILSTESCAICRECTWPCLKPCRHPEHMHPPMESHGIIVENLAQKEGMDYNIGGNTVLWFSVVLFREKSE